MPWQEVTDEVNILSLLLMFSNEVFVASQSSRVMFRELSGLAVKAFDGVQIRVLLGICEFPPTKVNFKQRLEGFFSYHSCRTLDGFLQRPLASGLLRPGTDTAEPARARIAVRKVAENFMVN